MFSYESISWDVQDIDNQQGFLAGSPIRAVWMTALIKCLMCYELFSSLVNQSGSVITYYLQTTNGIIEERPCDIGVHNLQVKNNAIISRPVTVIVTGLCHSKNRY